MPGDSTSLPRIPIWQPTMPTSPNVEGPNQGSGEGPSGPVASAGTIDPNVKQPLPQGIKARLGDPRLAGWLMTVGSAMGAPPTVGQTGWGRAAQAMGQGYNYLAMQRELQSQRERQAYEDQIKAQELARTQAESQARIEESKANTTLARQTLETKVTEAEKDRTLTREQKEADRAADAAKLQTEIKNRREMTTEQLAAEAAMLDKKLAQSRAELSEQKRSNMSKEEIARRENELKELQIQMMGNKYATESAVDLERINLMKKQGDALTNNPKGQLTDSQAKDLDHQIATELNTSLQWMNADPMEWQAEFQRRREERKLSMPSAGAGPQSIPPAQRKGPLPSLNVVPTTKEQRNQAPAPTGGAAAAPKPPPESANLVPGQGMTDPKTGERWVKNRDTGVVERVR
ncbi:MAG TPA: hypothetical protein VF077_00410 [Nitrospiraceae bacterium]